MLGNAVPSLLAEVLAREIRRQLLGTTARGGLKLLPPRLDSMPMPEPLRPVPDSYLKLVGDHAEHPGTGKGRGALRRKAEGDAQAALF